jgi:hypothetical protein
MVAVVVPVKVGTQRRLLEVGEAVVMEVVLVVAKEGVWVVVTEEVMVEEKEEEKEKEKEVDSAEEMEEDLEVAMEVAKVEAVVLVKVGTQRRLLEVGEAVDSEQRAAACSSAAGIK